MAKFKDLNSFSNKKNIYNLLPFNFDQIDNDIYLATNFVGEHILIKKSDLGRFVNKELTSTSNIYKELKSKHFLYENKNDIAIDLLALKKRTKLNFLKEFTGLHIMVTSLRCEHSCPYCQVSRANTNSNKNIYDMSHDTAIKSLELIFQSPNNNIKIEFQGGEPLLNFEIIKFIVNHSEKIKGTKNVQYVIATNLAMINQDILEFAKINNIFFSTSLDGPENLHNKNRPRKGNNSYQKTIEGIEKIRESIGYDKISALMTTTKDSLSKSKEIIDEYIENGFSGIFLRQLSPYGFAIKTKYYESYEHDEWLDFYFKGLEYIIKLNKDGLHFVEYLASIFLQKILTPFDTNYVDLMTPAGIGIGVMVYNYNGEVYLSDEGRMLAEMGDKKFCVGNVHTDSYKNLLLSDKFLDPLEYSMTTSVPMCSECSLEPYCGSDPVFHYATQKDFVGIKAMSPFCSRNTQIIRKIILMMENDKEIKKIFYSWIN